MHTTVALTILSALICFSTNTSTQVQYQDTGQGMSCCDISNQSPSNIHFYFKHDFKYNHLSLETIFLYKY